MDQAKINRINELYKKSKKEGLTPAEKEEQAKLRQEYLAAVRKNIRGTLDNVSVLNPDGSVTELAKVAKKNRKQKSQKLKH
ncbi:DUF896 domain-containing protein [[Clostridium] polysaccharolyticum]|uniref:UPF0291 protein SAMN04487772_10637 n=1 Tax=[Clostridium] polysaccharolyticum TaxID=29364 RepID=A0A1I0AVZ2_9FIRM|nr:DUF896 domain-containing protein [[Clostridium] polysaccharolyticum]SES97741.1 Uncharacterized protein YnzC, UPF0291/DUF896 family [[Clostridium] polysaccharolyticum]